MESNITDQQFWSSNSQLAEPHFDQEATLLSARPVVPIDKVSVNAGVSRAWLFGFALAGILLVVMSATAIYYSRLAGNQSQPTPAAETVSSGVGGFVSDPVDLDALEPSKPTEPGDPSVSELPKTVQRSSSANRPNHSSNPSKEPTHRGGAVVVVQNPASDEEIRDERRAARREAKAQKRANRQRRRGKHETDLLRIREIFEGPMRP